jgi:hypothetical protein
MHSSIPTIRASKIANSMYTSLNESATLPRTLETNRETNATGPTASWREDPILTKVLRLVTDKCQKVAQITYIF